MLVVEIKWSNFGVSGQSVGYFSGQSFEVSGQNPEFSGQNAVLSGQNWYFSRHFHFSGQRVLLSRKWTIK